jgi:hypothetical protein
VGEAKLRRKLEHLARLNEPVAEADRRYFERFPQRRHRFRLASREEIAAMQAMDGLPRGCTHYYFVIRQLEPGVRMKFAVGARRPLDLDMTERDAAELFAWSADNAVTESGVRLSVEAIDAAFKPLGPKP